MTKNETTAIPEMHKTEIVRLLKTYAVKSGPNKGEKLEVYETKKGKVFRFAKKHLQKQIPEGTTVSIARATNTNKVTEYVGIGENDFGMQILMTHAKAGQNVH